MKVYVLTEGYDYEGENVIGAFSTKEKATIAKAKAKELNKIADYQEIYELELDVWPQ